MKIGIDIRTLMDSRYSGVSEYTVNLIKEILRLDHNNEYRLFYNSFGDFKMPEFKENNVRLVKYNYPNKILNYLLFKFFNYPKINKDLMVDTFFMPHINFIGMSLAGKKIITIHDLSFLKYSEFFSWRKNFWHKMINVKKLIKRFDMIIAVSENTKRDIVKLCDINENKIKVIYPGLSEEFINKEINESKRSAVKSKYELSDKYILYLGTVEPRKNVEGVIKAYNELRKSSSKFKDYKLVIIGDKGWKSNNVYKEWGRSEFKNDIKFLGYINSQERIYFYSSASVFIYPSFYEGFGFPPLEAMACGCPVITSYAASLPEVVEEASLMVNPYDINDIAQAIKQILSNENLKNKLVVRGLEQAKKFNWRNAAEQYLKIFNNE